MAPTQPPISGATFEAQADALANLGRRFYPEKTGTHRTTKEYAQFLRELAADPNKQRSDAAQTTLAEIKQFVVDQNDAVISAERIPALKRDPGMIDDLLNLTLFDAQSFEQFAAAVHEIAEKFGL